MEEIKINEYVRTKEGEIIKVREDYDIFTDDDGLFIDAYMLPYEQKIVKHSPNIIDLIEVGDIIEYDSNNYGTDILEVVVETCTVEEDYEDGEGFVCTALDTCIRTKNIKSVITKEMIESIKYEV